MADAREGHCFGLIGGLGATVYYDRAHAARGLTMRVHSDAILARVAGEGP